MTAQDEPEFLQVYMVHEATIEGFKRWVTSQGWELKLMPRFNDNDDTYIPTHMIVPANLDQIMAERAAEHRKEHGLE